MSLYDIKSDNSYKCVEILPPETTYNAVHRVSPLNFVFTQHKRTTPVH